MNVAVFLPCLTGRGNPLQLSELRENAQASSHEPWRIN
jgi:hypothetical protein